MVTANAAFRQGPPPCPPFTPASILTAVVLFVCFSKGNSVGKLHFVLRELAQALAKVQAKGAAGQKELLTAEQIHVFAVF